MEPRIRHAGRFVKALKLNYNNLCAIQLIRFIRFFNSFLRRVKKQFICLQVARLLLAIAMFSRIRTLLCKRIRYGSFFQKVGLSSLRNINFLVLFIKKIVRYHSQCCGTVTIYYGSGSGSDF
jgi:hypothetical protein